MPTVVTTHLPNGNVTDSAFWTKVGGSLFSVIQTDDGDTSYVEANGPDGDFVLCDIQDINGLCKRIDQVKVVNVRKKLSADTGRTKFGVNHASLGDSVSAEQDSTTSYAAYNQVCARPGGGNWSNAEFNALRVKLMTFDPDGNPDAVVRHTKAVVEATWFYPMGGSVFFFEVLLPVLGAVSGIMPRHVPGLVAYLTRKTGHRLVDRPEAVLADLRAARLRRYFDLYLATV